MITITRKILFVFVFLLPLLPEEFGFKSKSLPDFSIIRTILLMLVFSLGLSFLLDKRFANQAIVRIRQHIFPVGLIAVFFCWSLVPSTLSSAGINSLFAAMRDIIYFFVPFLATLISLRRLRDIESMVLILMFSACLVSIVGLIEYFFEFQLYSAITGPDSAWNTFQTMKGGEFNGVLASFPHPLAFGSFLVNTVFMVLLLYMHRGNTLFRFGTPIVIAMFLLGIYASTSRGAQAGLVAGIAFGGFLYLITIYKKVVSMQKPIALFVLVLPFILIILSGVAYMGYDLVHGGTERQFTSAMMRIVQMGKGIPIIEARPILGYGVGQAAESLGMIAKTVDNYYLTIALESGVVGLAIFFIVISYFLLKAAKAYLSSRSVYFLVMAMFFSASGTQLLVLSLKQALPILYIGFAVLLILLSENRQPTIAFFKRISNGQKMQNLRHHC